MTPMSVLKMIRDGVNPLQTSMEDLEEYLSGQDTYAEDSEKYSRFLYRLEQNNEITPEEKSPSSGFTVCSGRWKIRRRRNRKAGGYRSGGFF